jgi:hypothetical protein
MYSVSTVWLRRRKSACSTPSRSLNLIVSTVDRKDLLEKLKNDGDWDVVLDQRRGSLEGRRDGVVTS